MKTKILFTIALALSLSFTASEAFACGGITAQNSMCVALPPTLSTFLQNEQVREILRAKGNIRHLTADGKKVTAAYSDSQLVSATISNGEVTGIKQKKYSWPIDPDFLVRIQDSPALVKLLIGTQINTEMARTRGEKSTITALAMLATGSPAIRVNGDQGYTIEGIMNPDGSLEGIVIR
jgi:hypothetical protein